MAAEVKFDQGKRGHFMENGDACDRGKDFSGYGGLRQIELPKPQPAKDRVLVRVTAAGVTPLDHTILSGAYREACYVAFKVSARRRHASLDDGLRLLSTRLCQRR
jgi:hypothetical protein